MINSHSFIRELRGGKTITERKKDKVHSLEAVDKQACKEVREEVSQHQGTLKRTETGEGSMEDEL